MDLIIVESPVKSKTIEKFLGKDYIVSSSYGHIRDLPERKLGVDVDNDFKPEYVIPIKAKPKIKELKSHLKESDNVILATDEDREGEAIAWHLIYALKLKDYKRIVFHEITEKAIKQALKEPRKIDENLVNAQQARRILDRLVGYKLSPFLWKKIVRGLSAGRVQSVAVRLIVEKEREIEKFKPEEYWTIEALFKQGFSAELKKEIKNEKESDNIIKDLDKAEYIIDKIIRKETKKNPYAPFTTSTLQQESWHKLRFPAKKTMITAQNLYERGLCVDENSLVITKEGEIYKIKELENENKTLIGIDEKKLQIKNAEVNKFWKIKAPRKILSIETDCHEKILITKDHPLMILRKGYPLWIKGENIKQGDYLAAPELINVQRKEKSSNILEIAEKFPEEIKQRIIFKFSSKSFVGTKIKQPKEFIYYQELKSLLQNNKIDIKTVEKFYQGVRIKPKRGASNFHKIPFNINCGVSYLLGLIMGDGHLNPEKPKINIANKPKYVLGKLNKLLEEILGIKFNRFTTQRNQVPINSTFLYFFAQQFGIPTGNKAATIEISNNLISQPDEIVKSFIAGLWDSDGCITKCDHANSIRLSYSSRSEIFIDRLRLLLKTFGINSSKHLDKRNKVFWLLLTSNGIPKFRDNIVPYLIIKKRKWDNLYKNYGKLYEKRIVSHCQKIPNINFILEDLLLKNNFPKQKLSKLIKTDLFNYFGGIDKTHNRLPFIQKAVLKRISKFIDTEDKIFNRLSNSPIIWKKINSIKHIPYKKNYVFDVTTPTNTFIVNGIVSHNCTYHRTDSLNLSSLSLNTAQKFIEKEYGKQYSERKAYKTKSKTAQEAHEAIRPTFPNKVPESIKDLTPIQFKLYDLIWRRFMASQMKPALFDSMQVDIKAKDYLFRANGQTLKFDGYLKVYPVKFEQNTLPELKEKDILNLKKLIPSQHFTQPPARYTEASLIKVLEKEGIGRPSTYAPTLDTIQRRNYVQKNEQKRFQPTEIGILVNDLLIKHFPNIVDIKFTANMEENLDDIAQGEQDWKKVLKDFYNPFIENLNIKEEEVSKIDMTEKTEKKCPKCKENLIIRYGRFGKFYACSGFPKCKHTESLEQSKLNIPCPKCKGEITEKRTKKNKIFYGCSKFPKCDYALWYKPIKETCPKCKSLLMEKGKKIVCSNKDCDFKK